jgi:ectoine hydroxylase-related dioxygenase (phytanoyl-CoA dioxygenase family)
MLAASQVRLGPPGNDIMNLTAEEFFLFAHNGYMLIPQVLTRDVLKALTATIAQHVEKRIAPVVCEDPDRPGYGKNGDIAGARVLRLSKVLNRDPIFYKVASSPRLVAVLQDLLGPNVDVVLNRHNHVTLRPPGAAKLEWHRDVANWSRPIISAVFYLEDSTLDNGCTWVLPGSHHMLAYHARLEGHGRLDSLERMGQQSLPVLARAGDVLIFNGLMLHGAGANGTDATRMSMTLGYHAVDELGFPEEAHKLLVAGERVLRHN